MPCDSSAPSDAGTPRPAVVARPRAPDSAAAPRVTRAAFGTLPDSGAVEQFTLTNAHGIEVRVITYGAIITSMLTPDQTGALGDIVFGYDSLSGYVTDASYFGAVVGRYRESDRARHVHLDGHAYTLATNDGPNTLHGGRRGFNKVIWSGEPFTHGDTVGVTLRYTSRDGEEGYPGNLQVGVTYALTPNDELVVDYEGTTDKPTPVNLSQHSYWNLHGGGTGTILDHVLTIDASHYTPVDSTLIPTGEIAPVAGTPFDFRTPTAIGARIGQTDTQLRFGNGYDHNLVLDRKGAWARARGARSPTPRPAARSTSPRPSRGCSSIPATFWTGPIHGKGGQAVRPSRRDRARDAALSGLAESPGVSVDDSSSGRHVPLPDGLHLRRGALA